MICLKINANKSVDKILAYKRSIQITEDVAVLLKEKRGWSIFGIVEWSITAIHES